MNNSWLKRLRWALDMFTIRRFRQFLRSYKKVPADYQMSDATAQRIIQFVARGNVSLQMNEFITDNDIETIRNRVMRSLSNA